MDNDLGNRIRKIRESKNQTMEEFGENNFNPPASKGVVSNWENGYNRPNKKRLEKIAEMGNTTVDELLYGDYKEYVRSILYKAVSEDERFQSSLNKYFSHNAVSNFYKEDGEFNVLDIFTDNSSYNFTMKDAYDLIESLLDDILELLKRNKNKYNPDNIILSAQLAINSNIRESNQDFTLAVERIENFLKQFDVLYPSPQFSKDEDLSSWIDVFAEIENMERDEAKKITLNNLYLKELADSINQFIKQLNKLKIEYKDKINSDI